MSDIREKLMEVIANRTAPNAADAILAAGWTPPTVKPSLEQVVDALAAQPPGNAEWTSSRIMQAARAVLALLPGRSEAEVRQDEAERIAAWVTADEPSDTLVLLADALRRGDHRG